MEKAVGGSFRRKERKRSFVENDNDPDTMGRYSPYERAGMSRIFCWPQGMNRGLAPFSLQSGYLPRNMERNRDSSQIESSLSRICKMWLIILLLLQLQFNKCLRYDVWFVTYSKCNFNFQVSFHVVVHPPFGKLNNRIFHSACIFDNSNPLFSSKNNPSVPLIKFLSIGKLNNLPSQFSVFPHGLLVGSGRVIET